MFGPWLAASPEHLLGTNALGYDIFTELIYGTRQTLLVGLTSSILTLLLGSVIGTLAAGKGRQHLQWIHQHLRSASKAGNDDCTGKLSRKLQQKPDSADCHVQLGGNSRSVRAKVIHLNSQPFIENCVIQGYSREHIVTHHILPNLYDVLISRFLLGVNSCIMMESTLSFLGFGDLYFPTWGTMINFCL